MFRGITCPAVRGDHYGPALGASIISNVSRDLRNGALDANAGGERCIDTTSRFAAAYFGARRLEPLQSSECALSS
jgi:hypothetical protein